MRWPLVFGLVVAAFAIAGCGSSAVEAITISTPPSVTAITDPVTTTTAPPSTTTENVAIRIWGQCDGAYAYESVMGAEISLPSIVAKYVEKG